MQVSTDDSEMRHTVTLDVSSLQTAAHKQLCHSKILAHCHTHSRKFFSGKPVMTQNVLKNEENWFSTVHRIPQADNIKIGWSCKGIKTSPFQKHPPPPQNEDGFTQVHSIHRWTACMEGTRHRVLPGCFKKWIWYHSWQTILGGKLMINDRPQVSDWSVTGQETD